MELLSTGQRLDAMPEGLSAAGGASRSMVQVSSGC